MDVGERGTRRAIRLAALCAALSCVAARTLAADGIDVRLSLHPDDAYEVDGTFVVCASSGAVLDVLADYERIPEFVRSMKLSRVRETRADGTVLVEQEAVGGLFFVSKKVRVLLEIERTPEGLRFDDVAHEDFWVYAGGWDAVPAAGGTRVEYRLLAQPDFPAPAFLLRGVMRRGAYDLLSEVRGEILRRARRASPETTFRRETNAPRSPEAAP